MSATDREADLQAALSRAAHHRPQPGDFLKLQPALVEAWKLDRPEAWERMQADIRQNPRIAAYVDAAATQTPSQVPDSPVTSEGHTGAGTE